MSAGPGQPASPTLAALAISLQRAFSFEATKLKSPLRACLRPPGARNPNNPDGAETLSAPTSPPWAQEWLLGQLFSGSTPAAECSPHRISTQPRSPHPWFLPSFGGRREMRFWAPERTFPGAKESGSRRSKKSSRKVAAPRVGESLEASVQAVPSEWATDHLGVPSAGASAPRGPAAAEGSAGLSPRQGPSAGHAPGVVAGGSASPPAVSSLGLRRRCPPQREPSASGSSKASVFPTLVARGAREQPPDAPRRLEGEGLRRGEYGALGGRPQPGPYAGKGTAETARAAPEARRAVLSALAPASPAAEGGTARAPERQAGSAGDRRLLGHRLLDAREAAPCTATAATAASAAPPQMGGEINSPSSCRRQEEPWTPALVLPEAAKLWARPRWLAVSSRFASGTGQVAGVWEGGSGQLRSSHLGTSEWGWQLDNPQPRHPSLSSWGRCSGHPSQHRGLAPHSSPPSSGAGWGVLPDFSH